MTHPSIDSEIHEEVAAAAASFARMTGDKELAEMARQLREAIDAEEPGTEIVARIRAHVRRAP